MTFAKFPYQLLSDNCTATACDLQDYLVFKQYCVHASKSGYVRKGELQQISTKSGIGINKLYRLQRTFKERGWLVATEHGYQLPALIKLNSTHNLNLTTTTNKRGMTFIPAFKVKEDQIEHLEAVKIKELIRQIWSRFLHTQRTAKTNMKHGNNVNKQPVNFERMEISIRTICMQGNYLNEMQVSRIIDKAVKLGLIIKNKHGYNVRTGRNNCNTYCLPEALPVVGLAKKKNRVTRKVRTPIILNEVEQKFKTLLDSYQFRYCLVSTGIVKKAALKTKKDGSLVAIGYNRWANILNEICLRPAFKKILVLHGITEHNLNVGTTYKSFPSCYNGKVVYDKIELSFVKLVTENGNYDSSKLIDAKKVIVNSKVWTKAKDYRVLDNINVLDNWVSTLHSLHT
jgi:hypothetical protein